MLLAAALLLSACTPLVEDVAPAAQRAYATFYPIYALSTLIAEGSPGITLSCLVDPQDGCLRNYALSDRDAYLLQHSADIVVAGGRGLESFEQSLYSLGESGPAVMLILYNLELYNQDDKSAVDEDSSHLVGPNPHLYMSVDGAKALLEAITIYFSELDLANQERYFANLDAAEARLNDLKAEISAETAGVSGQSVILLNEALVYLAQDFDLAIAGQYDRESGSTAYESEIAIALEEISAMDARVVLLEKQAPQALVAALEDAGYTVAKIDILSTGRADMGAEGYFLAQRENAQAIARAFQDAGGAR